MSSYLLKAQSTVICQVLISCVEDGKCIIEFKNKTTNLYLRCFGLEGGSVGVCVSVFWCWFGGVLWGFFC